MSASQPAGVILSVSTGHHHTSHIITIELELELESRARAREDGVATVSQLLGGDGGDAAGPHHTRRGQGQEAAGRHRWVWVHSSKL